MRASVTCLLALALVGATACGQQRTENQTTENQATPAPGEQTQQQTQLRERAEEKKEAGATEQQMQGHQTQKEEQQKAAEEKTAEEQKAQAGAKAKTAEDKAEQLRKDADEKADKLKKDAEARCDQLKKNAEAEGDRIKKEADVKADRLKGKTGPTTAAPAKARGEKHAKGIKAKEQRREAREGGRPGVTKEGREERAGRTTVTGAEVPRERPGQPEQPVTAPQGAVPPVSGQPVGAEPYVNHSTVLGDGKSGMYTDGQGTYGGRATWGTGTPRR